MVEFALVGFPGVDPLAHSSEDGIVGLAVALLDCGLMVQQKQEILLFLLAGPEASLCKGSGISGGKWSHEGTLGWLFIRLGGKLFCFEYGFLREHFILF